MIFKKVTEEDLLSYWLTIDTVAIEAGWITIEESIAKFNEIMEKKAKDATPDPDEEWKNR